MVELRPMEASDWEAVAQIYGEGIATGNATFETSIPLWQDWDAAHLPEARWVAEEGGLVCGWAALSPVSSRSTYAGVAEVSVYVAASHRGRRLGTRLLQALVTSSEDHGIWTLQSGIFPENTASLKAHASVGFREVGRRERLGQLDGVWRDVLLLERRSPSVN